MKQFKAFTALALSAVLTTTLVLPVFAEAAPTQKEEVLYVMTDATGQVNDLEAVNIFAGGDITDYGDYSAVKPLNTTDTITQDGDRITFTSDADKVYYQGTMKDTTIPWDISIRYTLDGRECTPEEVAGQSGALEIHFVIQKNENCPGSFYEDYALQAAFTLDTENCKNIQADGATMANVGSNKQLSYTILPGRGIDTVIRADVTDFEMPAVTINGVRLKLNIEVDDAALTEKVNELVSAVGTLDDGASNLNSGAGALSEATGLLNSKVGELNTGVGRLSDGAGTLSNGLDAITEKNDTLTAGAYAAYEGLCTAAGTALNAQLEANGMEPVTLTPSNYGAVLDDLLEQMGALDVREKAYQTALQTVQEKMDKLPMDCLLTEEQKAQLRDAAVQKVMASDEVTEQIDAAVAKVSEAAGQVSALKSQLDNYGTFYQGLVDYTGAVSQAATGADALKTNLDTLHDNTGLLESSVGTLDEAVGKLYGGTQQLADGTSEFVNKTSGMDAQIEDQINSMISSLSGGEDGPVSFVSDKNTNVSSVQFVIKTAAVEKAEAPAAEAPAEAPRNFWQKLLHLFGLN